MSPDGWLPDRVSVGALTKAFPPELVDQVVEATGTREVRRRLLPARLADRNFLSQALAGKVLATGAHILWRAPASLALRLKRPTASPTGTRSCT